MTSIVALGLLGQTITSVLLDRFGWLGAPKRRVDRSVAVALISAPVGIFLMLDGSVSQSILAVLLSLGAGVTVVLSRMVNARLASETSPLAGSFVNHLVGLPICVVLLLLVGQWTTPAAGTMEPWMYCGGMLGVTTVLLFNITVPKVSAFRLTLLSFVGQVFTGVALDVGPDGLRRVVPGRIGYRGGPAGVAAAWCKKKQRKSINIKVLRDFFQKIAVFKGRAFGRPLQRAKYPGVPNRHLQMAESPANGQGPPASPKTGGSQGAFYA